MGTGCLTLRSVLGKPSHTTEKLSRSPGRVAIKGLRCPNHFLANPNLLARCEPSLFRREGMNGQQTIGQIRRSGRN